MGRRASYGTLGPPHSNKTTNGHNPFFLAYGSEAMLSVKTIVPSYRRIHCNPKENKVLLNMLLDLIEERKNEAALKTAKRLQNNTTQK